MVGSIISGVAQLGSTIYGAAASASNNKKARQLLDQQKADNKAWYEKRMSEDYISRSDTQDIINKQRELMGEQLKRAKAAQVVTGGSDESLAMQQAQANKSLADTMSGIAANASNYKDSIEQQYMQRNDDFTAQQMQSYLNQANAAAQAGSQAA